MAYQYPLNGGRINATITGNTAGVGSLVSTGTLSLAGGNNITLSQNGNAITISGANAPSGSINFSAGTTSSNLNSVVFSNSGGVSFGLNGGTITGTVATNYAASSHSHGNPTLNLTNMSGTTASASNGFTLSLSAASQSAQTQSNIQGVIASGSTNYTGNISFANSNGVSFGLNGGTITASAAGGGDTVTMDYYQNMDRGATAALAVPFTNNLMFQRLNQENDLFAGNITANTVLLNMTGNINATVTTAHTVSAYIGIYTDNATNLSLLNSASTSWGLAGGNNTSVYNGPRWLSFVSSQWSAAPVFSRGGDYVFGILMKSSSFAPPLSYFGQNYMLSNQRSGYIGTTMATNTSMAHGNFWNAVMATASLPSSVHSTQVNRNNASAIFMPHIILNNRYSSL